MIDSYDEPLGTRQMKWIDYWLWQYQLESIQVKKSVVSKGFEDFRSREMSSQEVVYPVDHRYRFPGEMIIDLDFKEPIKTWFQMCDLANDIYHYLREERLEHPVLCHSGGKGFHIHVFKDNEESSAKLLERTVKDLRLHHLVKREVLDGHLTKGRHLIREIGGRSFGGPNIRFYKTMLTDPHNFTALTDKKAVDFPNEKMRNKMKENMIYVDDIYIGGKVNG